VLHQQLVLLKKHTSREKHIKVIEDFFAFSDCESKFAR
jgi:hypothetical protein